MKCPKCGKETPNNKPLCVNCGANIIGLTRLHAGEQQSKPDKPAPDRDAGKDKSGAEREGETQFIQGGSQGNRDKPPRRGQKPPAPGTRKDKDTDAELELLRKALTGRYEITRKLGTGGMASVYHAREIALEREVAIKLLPQSFLRDEQFIARFKREAQVAANLEHPHIVRIYQIGEEENLCYFVMSYIPGGSISDQIRKRGPLQIDDIVQWGMDVCSALGYAHDHGVIHRDLKPDNIMLDKSKRAVVMDFGIARAAQASGLTQTGAVIGTPQYMSPEQARGIELDARSDIYSMGLVLYQMATATLPFQASDPASLMYMHVHQAPEPPDVRNKNVPAWLRDIVLKCLEKNPDDRYSHARELRIALAEHKAPELTARTIVKKKMAEKKSKAGLLAGAAVIVIAAAVAGWFWWNSQQKALEQVSRQPVTDTEQLQEQPSRVPPQPQISADDLTFQQAEMTNTKQAYITYQEKYPEGKHIDEAREKIAAFEEREREAAKLRELEQQRKQQEQTRLAEERRAEQERQRSEAARQDDQAFQQAQTDNTRLAFNTYLQTYPGGRHAAEAREKIAALDKIEAEQKKTESEEQTRRDDEAFRIATNTNTKEAYSTYLISFPDGGHSSEARTRIAAIDEKEKFEKKIGVTLSAMSINMSEIPAGSFQMGSNNGDGDEKPISTISLSAFHMSTTEITQAQYKAVIGSNPSFHKLDDNCPVERVSWKDAITFCNRLSEKIGLEPCYNLNTGSCDYSKNGFRLPTEAEWEYACRAGTGTEYNTGDGESALARAGWYARNSAEKTQPVGQKTPNKLGLYDMHGNVWEWCNDWYSNKSYELDKKENPTGLSQGNDRVLRGGGWLDWPKDCRSAKRRNHNPDKNYSDIGFRIVRR